MRKHCKIKILKCYTLYKIAKILKKDRSKIEEKWKTLQKQALTKNPNFKEPVVPYMEHHIVGEHNGLNNGNIFFL